MKFRDGNILFVLKPLVAEADTETGTSTVESLADIGISANGVFVNTGVVVLIGE